MTVIVFCPSAAQFYSYVEMAVQRVDALLSKTGRGHGAFGGRKWSLGCWREVHDQHPIVAIHPNQLSEFSVSVSLGDVSSDWMTAMNADPMRKQLFAAWQQKRPVATLTVTDGVLGCAWFMSKGGTVFFYSNGDIEDAKQEQIGILASWGFVEGKNFFIFDKGRGAFIWSRFAWRRYLEAPQPKSLWQFWRDSEEFIEIAATLLPLDIILQGIGLCKDPSVATSARDLPYFAAATSGQTQSCWFEAMELSPTTGVAPFDCDPTVVESAACELGPTSEGDFLRNVLDPTSSISSARGFSLSRKGDVGALRLVWELVKANGDLSAMPETMRGNTALV